MVAISDEGVSVPIAGSDANGTCDMRMARLQRFMDVLDLVRIAGRP